MFVGRLFIDTVSNSVSIQVLLNNYKGRWIWQCVYLKLRLSTCKVA